MNFRDMSRDDEEYYNRMCRCSDSMDMVLKVLSIAAGAISIATFMALFVW
jgi:hypothetical protein